MTTFQKHIESEIARIAQKATKKNIYFQTLAEMFSAVSLGEFEVRKLWQRGLGSQWEAHFENQFGDEIITILYENENHALVADAFEFYPKNHGI